MLTEEHPKKNAGADLPGRWSARAAVGRPRILEIESVILTYYCNNYTKYQLTRVGLLVRVAEQQINWVSY